VTKLAQALRQGTPNRNRIAMQMVKDMLDESSFTPQGRLLRRWARQDGGRGGKQAPPACVNSGRGARLCQRPFEAAASG